MANYQSAFTGSQHDAYVTKEALVNLIYPVGSIYISMNSTSPATLFGGTWEQIKGRFLLATGACSANSDNYFGTIKAAGTWNAGLGSTGGEDYHTLTINEMPSHQHASSGGWGAGATNTGKWRTDQNSPQNNWQNVGSTGGGQTHNNMPPYLAVNMWKRTG